MSKEDIDTLHRLNRQFSGHAAVMAMLAEEAPVGGSLQTALIGMSDALLDASNTMCGILDP